MPLVSDAQLQALRKVALSGMLTDVTRLERNTADNVYSDDGSVTWVADWTVKGWLRTIPEGTIDVVSGVMADVSIYRLFLPVDTALNNGDRVRIDSRNYTVTDTNKESTYQVVLRCSLRRVE